MNASVILFYIAAHAWLTYSMHTFHNAASLVDSLVSSVQVSSCYLQGVYLTLVLIVMDDTFTLEDFERKAFLFYHLRGTGLG